MPIEIRELHIRMSVDGGGTPVASEREQSSEARRAADDELLTRCVEHVMDLLRSRTER